MGSWWSNEDPFTTWANSILEEAIYAIQKNSKNHKGEVQSSLTYLKRQDVAKQAADHLRSIDAMKCDIHFRVQLELVFVELHAINEKNEVYELNFWPCSTCACVSCKKLED
jgi:hypothetical protein